MASVSQQHHRYGAPPPPPPPSHPQTTPHKPNPNSSYPQSESQAQYVQAHTPYANSYSTPSALAPSPHSLLPLPALPQPPPPPPGPTPLSEMSNFHPPDSQPFVSHLPALGQSQAVQLASSQPHQYPHPLLPPSAPGHESLASSHRNPAPEESVRRKEEGRIKAVGDAHGSKHGARGGGSGGSRQASHGHPSHVNRHHTGGPKDSRHDPKQSLPGGGDGKTENRLKRPSTFLCKVKFCNQMPEPVSHPKLIPLNSNIHRYTDYRITTLERNMKHKLHVEADLGIPLDLLDLSAYKAPPASQRPLLDPADAALLSDDMDMSKERDPTANRIKERPSDKGLSWLVHTQYISPVMLDSTPKKRVLNEKEAKRLALQLELGDEEQIDTREGQISVIEESFRAAREAPVHPTNPSLQPLEILPIVPNLDRMEQQFVQLVFDDDPLEDSEQHRKLHTEIRKELESRALMKNFRVSSGGEGEARSFVAYMVPSVDEGGRVRGEDEDGEEEYEWVREYHWTVSKSESGRDSFLFCFGDENVSYVQVGAKLTVGKFKARGGAKGREEESEEMPVPSRIIVRKRGLDEGNLEESRAHKRSKETDTNHWQADERDLSEEYEDV